MRWLGLLAVVAVLGACPKPSPPTPIGPPDASDAAARPPSGAKACDHAETVCPHSSAQCLGSVNRINDPNFTRCVMAATSCQALNDCDPLNAGNSVRARPLGR